MFLQKLLPKEDKYFEYFNDMITHVGEMAELVHAGFSAQAVDPDLVLKLKPLEKRCDEINGKVIKQMNKTFVTPFDREDVFGLIKRLDDISDILLGVGNRIVMFAVESPIPEASSITTIVVQQTKQLTIAINELRKRERSMDACKAVKDLESEADHIYHQVMRKLFTEETNAIEVIKKKEILDMLEKAADKCQSVANVLIAIYLKNA